MRESLLAQVEKVDTLPYDNTRAYYKLVTHDGNSSIGYMPKAIAELFEKEDKIQVDQSAKLVQLSKSLDTYEKRNEFFAFIGEKWRKFPEFADSLDKGWRDELYTAYAPTGVPYFLVERALSVLLGIITYGVHVNCYVPSNKSTSGKLKMWIPRRSPTKPTYPGKLDNLVAGGIGYPYGIWETLLKEGFEEAGLSSDFLLLRAESGGVVLYIYEPKGPGGNVQPEVEYIFDVMFDDESSITPVNQDGEAEDFRLMDIEEILHHLLCGEFKPNCGLVIIDFLIRHGIITPESEKNYLEIMCRSHRRLPFPTM